MRAQHSRDIDHSFVPGFYYWQPTNQQQTKFLNIEELTRTHMRSRDIVHRFLPQNKQTILSFLTLKQKNQHAHIGATLSVLLHLIHWKKTQTHNNRHMHICAKISLWFCTCFFPPTPKT